MSQLLNELSVRTIVELETGGQRYYNPKAEVPGGSSGVTFGVGIDLGYTTPKEIGELFWEIVTGAQLEVLQKAYPKIRQEAKNYLPRVADIQVEWDQALYLFGEHTVPKFYKLACSAFPGLTELNPNTQGALVSLVFNRGPSLAGDRRVEMRAIRDLVPKKDTKAIAQQLRKMKRVWTGTDIEAGMYSRREQEARLAETLR